MDQREEQGRRRVWGDVGSASPGPTLMVTGHWAVILMWLLLVMWVMCFIAECFCVQFHSASDSQSSGVGLLVFSKSRCWEGYVEG